MPPLLSRIQPRLRTLFSQRGAPALYWVAALGMLEYLGRSKSTDLFDLIGVCLVLVMVASLAFFYQRRPIPVIDWLLAKLRIVRGLFEQQRIRIGVDYRGKPELPDRFPATLARMGVTALVGVVLLSSSPDSFPSDLRLFLKSVSGAVYLVLLSGLWVTLLGSTLIISMFLAAEWNLLLARMLPHETRPVGLRYTGYLLGFGAVVLIAGHSTPIVPLILLTIAGVSRTLFLAWNGPGIKRVWNADKASGLQGSISSRKLELWFLWILFSGIYCLSLLSFGDRLDRIGSQNTWLTFNLGQAFAWSASLFVTLHNVQAIWRDIARAKNDPTRPLRPRLWVCNSGSESLPVGAQDIIRSSGFDIAGERSATDVPVNLLDDSRAEQLRASDWNTSWPLAMHSSQLEDEGLVWKLGRRHEILCRRALRRGLESLIKDARAKLPKQTTGLWVNPHQPQFEGILPDGDASELEQEFLGESFDRKLPLAARSHLAGVLKALDIDLIFMENAVSLRAFRRVLGALWETYDIHAGKLPAEERHFTGILGVRVVLIDVDLGGDAQLTGYPEPEYDEIGRARILHIFRDRGGDSPVEFDPSLFDFTPSPVLGGV